MCPPLCRFLQRWTSDVQPARVAAAQRLEETLAVVRALGSKPIGWVGDDDPCQALDDARRRFSANELVLATGSNPRHRRLEQRLLRFAERRTSCPITRIERCDGGNVQCDLELESE